jgi:uncharacterized protein YdhG (YjbR/CyaY superfamily)
MPKTRFKSVDEYMASLPEAAQAVLGRVRSTLRRAVPGAEETISYQMPTYKLPDGPVIYFASWKEHYSLYPASAYVLAELKDELAPYVISKGTIRFPFAQPVPAALIARIAKLRAAEVTGRKKAKAVPPKKRPARSRNR